jgi:hypothetical protein
MRICEHSRPYALSRISDIVPEKLEVNPVKNKNLVKGLTVKKLPIF